MRYYFAPMEGVTGWLLSPGPPPLVLRGGPVLHALSFAPAGTRLHPPGGLPIFLPEHNRGLYAVPQLLTRSADDFLWAAGVLADLGYREVNLNLGCPSGTVVAKGKGSGLLGRREELERLLDGIYARAGIPVSIKPGSAWRDPEEFPLCWSFSTAIPSGELIIHPGCRRTCLRNQPRLEPFAAGHWQAAAPRCATMGTWSRRRRPAPP